MRVARPDPAAPRGDPSCPDRQHTSLTNADCGDKTLKRFPIVGIHQSDQLLNLQHLKRLKVNAACHLSTTVSKKCRQEKPDITKLIAEVALLLLGQHVGAAPRDESGNAKPAQRKGMPQHVGTAP